VKKETVRIARKTKGEASEKALIFGKKDLSPKDRKHKKLRKKKNKISASSRKRNQ
jgi:hypothetical protein